MVLRPFPTTWAGVRKAAAENGLENNYCMTKTSICVLTNRSLEQFGELAPYFHEVTLKP